MILTLVARSIKPAIICKRRQPCQYPKKPLTFTLSPTSKLFALNHISSGIPISTDVVTLSSSKYITTGQQQHKSLYISIESVPFAHLFLKTHFKKKLTSKTFNCSKCIISSATTFVVVIYRCNSTKDYSPSPVPSMLSCPKQQALSTQ